MQLILGPRMLFFHVAPDGLYINEIESSLDKYVPVPNNDVFIIQNEKTKKERNEMKILLFW